MSSQNNSNEESDSFDFENDSELLRDALDGESGMSKSESAEQVPDKSDNIVDVV